MRKAVLILGATSAIARATATVLAAKGHPLFLAGRDQEELERIAKDLKIRSGVAVETGIFDVEDTESHQGFIEDVFRSMGGLDGVVMAIGYLGEHEKAIHDVSELLRIVARNFSGVCSVLTYVADLLEAQGDGFIVGISSVAGERGRQSNYVYGAAKAGLSIFLQGLRNRLQAADVQVLTVKPGFVDTAMTFGKPGMFLVASPQSVGTRIVKAIEQRRNVVYIPWFWSPIMAIIRCIPEGIFKKLRL